MALTDRAIRSTKPRSKPYKRFDERGLYLLVNPNGARYWRLKYRYDGKERVLALGVYADVSLKMARERRDNARRLVADGIDPNTIKLSHGFLNVEPEAFVSGLPSTFAEGGQQAVAQMPKVVFVWGRECIVLGEQGQFRAILFADIQAGQIKILIVGVNDGGDGSVVFAID